MKVAKFFNIVDLDVLVQLISAEGIAYNELNRAINEIISDSF